MNFIKSIWMAVALLVLGASLSHAQSSVGPSASYQLYNGFADPCQSAAAAKTSAVVNITTATTTELAIAPVGKKVYFCSLSTTTTGTPTFTFKTGTKVTNACDTSAVTVSGAYAPPAGSFNIGGDGTKLTTPVASELCLTSTGTPSLQGIAVFVIR